ncbi:uncharacterized protein LOC123918140 isoform X2 [Trifolium pratense]|uniref:uncharacterized protein LOC123918140 isoform X2 n=1 Tax=Trifolium pratense TaxID=57577 RepID=UPI001E692C45|nr:uncharacterized protein LOC123918140 isoform X2 [Trifolium pratense]
MADVEPEVAAQGVPKKRTFKKFSFRGVDLDSLLDMKTDELVKLFSARARRRFQRGLTRKPMALIKKLRKAADVEPEVAAQGVPKKRTFKKFSFRGVDLDSLLDMKTDELVKLFSSRARRRFQRGLTRKPMALIKKLRKAADVEPEVAAQGVPKKRTFKKFSFRGVDLDSLLDMKTDELVKLFSARARRRFQRGLTRKPMALIKKLRKAADVEPEVAAQGVPKKRTFKKFSFRGVDLDSLLDMKTDELVKLFSARARRRFQRGLTRKPMALVKKLRKAKREAPAGEKPEPVRTHLRNMIIVPEMIGSIIGVYNGKTFNQVEIKPEMIGHYLAEFSISYKPVKHGRPGIGATHSSRFIPLK